MNPLADRDVLILGLGASGLAMACWCANAGARVQVWDSREDPPQAAALRERCPQVQRIGGELLADRVHGLHGVFKSPGLAPHDARIAPLWEAAGAAGVRRGGELDLFVMALAQLKDETGYAPRLIAVTGTNGKTTTTALTALLVERAGRSVVAAGNIGPTLMDTLAARRVDGELPEVWVLELSSFQLADLAAPPPEPPALPLASALPPPPPPSAVNQVPKTESKPFRLVEPPAPMVIPTTRG